MVLKKNKIAVYGVCKNEELNIEHWYNSIKDADYIFLLDTGSTDNTISLAKNFGINILSAHFSPWSETQAKNTALSLLPKDIDICICLDLDQVVVTKNWKEILSDIELDFGIAEHEYLSHTGYLDSVAISNSSWIHERSGVSWVKYRPITFDYKRDFFDRTKVPITIKHLAGNAERFSDREPLYVEAFLNELKTIELYSSKDHLLNTLQLVSLSYFESGDYDNFVKYYNQFMFLYENTQFEETLTPHVFASFYTLSLAMSVYKIEEADKILTNIFTKESSDILNSDINLRLAIYFCITNNYQNTKHYLKYVDKDGIYLDVVCAIERILMDGINTTDALILSEYYGSINWGKSHQGMVNDFIKLNNVVHL